MRYKYILKIAEDVDLLLYAWQSTLNTERMSYVGHLTVSLTLIYLLQTYQKSGLGYYVVMTEYDCDDVNVYCNASVDLTLLLSDPNLLQFIIHKEPSN